MLRYLTHEVTQVLWANVDSSGRAWHHRSKQRIRPGVRSQRPQVEHRAAPAPAFKSISARHGNIRYDGHAFPIGPINRFPRADRRF